MGAPTLLKDQRQILAMHKNTWHLIQDPNHPVAIGYWGLIDKPLDAYPLVMYPMVAERNLTMMFWSPSYSHVAPFMLSAYDVFKRCPANHFWPWCAACQRFQWPPEDCAMHQNSRAHERALAKFKEQPMEVLRRWAWPKVDLTE